jgi:MerR family transcriptional regulator, light-induced transcriptional regulator
MSDTASAPVSQFTRHRDDEFESRLVQIVRSEIVPGLVTANRVIGSPAAEAPELAARDLGFGAGNIRAVDVARFVKLLRSSGSDAPPAFVEVLMTRGIPRHELYLKLLKPAAQMIGDMWLEDQCSFADVTVVVGRLQRILNGLREAGRRPVPEADAPSILLAAAPGDQHVFGVSMVETFFQDGGWRTALAHQAQIEDILELVRSRPFDALGFSFASDSQIEGLTVLIRSLRAEPAAARIMIALGGPGLDSPHAARLLPLADVLFDGGPAMALEAKQKLAEFRKRHN